MGSRMADPNAARARDLIAGSRYMTLATADAAGRPWATPVWFAAAAPDELLWVSRPQARHSRNIAERGDVAIAIFDSHVAVGAGEGVYLDASAEVVPDAELDRAIAAFSNASERQGAAAWSRAEVSEPAELRLYRAAVREAWALVPGGRDVRVSVELGTA